ncbi:flagellar hook-length control protein FliK [Rhodopseudomonas sp. NSM]|uniref:flagellar hook-length control protein FliK n=1 Tax=Rhodopseudomonas sp. NSM TaxID=3457630 RepID=UPI00403630CA
MTNADLLAAFRQLATARTPSRPSLADVAVGKDGSAGKDDKGRVAHFGDQLRRIAQSAKAEPKPELKPEPKPEPKREAEPAPRDPIEPSLIQRIEPPQHPAAEIAFASSAPAATPKPRAERPVDTDDRRDQPDWTSPDASLSVLISRLDQPRPPVAASDNDEADAITPVAPSPGRPQRQSAEPELSLATESRTSAAAEPRWQTSAAFSDTRTAVQVKVVVRQQETHFEPVQPFTLLQKIVDRIGADLPAMSSPAAPASAASPAASDRPAATPVRTLTLQLDPPDLGAVTVKMRLVGDAVQVRLSADRPDTAQLLRHERGALTDAMQSAGYTFEIAAIDQSRPADSGAGAGQQQAQQDHRPSQSSPGGSQLGDAGAQRQSGDPNAGSRHSRQPHDQIADPAERPRNNDADRVGTDGAVYL